MVQKKNKGRLFAIIIFGITSTLYILSQPCPSYYNWLCLIPLTYTIVNIAFGFIYSDKSIFNIFATMFNGIMFLRAVIMPVLLAAGGYVTSKTVNIEINMPRAILLFCYEMFFEYIAVKIMTTNRPLLLDDDVEGKIDLSHNYFSVIALLSVGCLLCLALAPMAVGYYRTIFGITDFEYTGFDSRDLISEYATSLPRKFGLITFRYFANVLRVVLPGIIIIVLRRKNVSKNTARIVTVLCIFVADFLLVDDTIATSLVNALITLLFYNKMFSNPKRLIYYFLYAMLGIIAYFTLRITLTNAMSNNVGVGIVTRISNILQAYFCGINNISAGLNLYTSSLFETYKYAIYEVLKGIPYASTIFGLDSTNIATLFNSVNHCTGQIVPTLASGTLYLTWLFAPLYCVLFLYISYKSTWSTQTSQKPLGILASITISVYAMMGISMYSPEATWAFIFCIGVPIKILSILFEKDRFDKRAKRYKINVL